MTSYDLDKEGKRVLPAHNYSGVGVSRYQFGERASTKKLTGIGRTLAMTMNFPSDAARPLP